MRVRRDEGVAIRIGPEPCARPSSVGAPVKRRRGSAQAIGGRDVA
jgi:hypothetical protein